MLSKRENIENIYISMRYNLRCYYFIFKKEVNKFIVFLKEINLMSLSYFDMNRRKKKKF